LINDSVYEFIDINVCQFTAINDGIYNNTGLENKYGRVQTPNCYLVPSIKYFKIDSSDNKFKISTFKFDIFDELTLENEYFGIRLGYYSNADFIYYNALWGEIKISLFDSFNPFNID
jgi:hypothetical protein